MNDKERAAMQRALEALEEMFHSNSTKVAIEKYNTAHNALREALDHFRDATKKVVEQEREPITEPVVPWLSHKVSEQAEQEPVAWFVQYKNRHEFVFGSKPEFIVDGVVEPLYAAPVRTKDLTDDEIAEACGWKFGQPMYEWVIGLSRAVIAADREKNK